MGYWISYLGVGYGGELRPYFGGGAVLLFALPVVIAGLLVPALALTGFAWTRKHRYGAFALALVLVGLIAMTAGFPEGTPLRSASNFTYNHFFPVQFLRTTYKAGPLVALGVALLAGLAAIHVRALSFAVVGLAVVACWPLVSGRALDEPAAVGRRAGGLARRGRPRRRDRRRRPRRRPARASSTPTTTGAGRSTRSCPRSRTSRWRRATPSATRTCTRSTCCGRSTRSSSSAARCRASSTRCSTCSAPARCWPAPTTTAPAAAPRLPRRPPTCSTSSGRPTISGASRGSARARRGRSARRARCRRCARGTARTRPGWCAWSRRSRSVVVDGSAEGVAALAAMGGDLAAPRLRGRPHCRGDRPGSGGRDHRLQPAARARALADGAERRAGAGRERGAVGRRGGAEPVPGPRQRRADRRRLRRDRGDHGAVVARLPAVPGAAAVRGRSTATPRRTGRPIAR